MNDPTGDVKHGEPAWHVSREESSATPAGSRRNPEQRKDPTTYDYSHPTRHCDMVMKGGITSGVVYPFAVCEIAQTFQFKNIGGTSAGAIAAAAAAAAEYGRHTATGGFQRLARLPRWLGSDSNMFDLFQPQASTKRLYRTLTAPIRSSDTPILATIGALIGNFSLWLLAGGALGIALIVATVLDGSGWRWWLSIGAGLVLAVLGMIVTAAVGVVVHLLGRVPKNRFGLCSGGPGVKETPEPLTWWLTNELDRLAGKDPGPDDDPLTFGDLWKGPNGAGRPDDRWLQLQMMTTSLSHGRPYRMPFSSRVWFFSPAIFRELFPERVVKWMERHPPPPESPSEADWWELECKLLEPLRPLPVAENLPVVVATRMSLSFPLLISAVPLAAVDYTRPMNQWNKDEWHKWLDKHDKDWEELRDDKAWLEAIDAERKPQAETAWFSDGGITSNFPVHFFDAPLPRWPTFALNLQPYHQDFPPMPEECHENNVWLPRSNSGGIAEAWTRFEGGQSSKAMLGFFRTIADTMQNWTDNTQLRVPGFRDRVAHIRHTEEEGGLNLAMPQEKIDSMSERGRCAGEKLITRFTQPPSEDDLSWDNHRWVRYRSAMTLLEGWLTGFRAAYEQTPEADTSSYQELLHLPTSAAPSYKWDTESQRTFAVRATEATVELSSAWKASGQTFTKKSPRPEAELRVRPRD
jgi:Patatin-like phospholipase